MRRGAALQGQAFARPAPGLERTSPHAGNHHVGEAWVDDESLVVSHGGRVSPIHDGSTRQSSSHAGSACYGVCGATADLFAGREVFLAGNRRRENIDMARGRLPVSLTDAVAAAASFRSRDSRSTADLFNDDEHVVGLDFHVTLSR